MGANKMFSYPGPCAGGRPGLVPPASDGTVTESPAEKAAAAAAAAASESDLDSEPEVRCSDSVPRAYPPVPAARRPGARRTQARAMFKYIVFGLKASSEVTTKAHAAGPWHYNWHNSFPLPKEPST